jgi:hypothetical protein
MKVPRLSLFALLLASAVAQPNPLRKLTIPLPPDDDDTFNVLAARATQTAFFDQLLDHNDPSKGTFKQQYWWNTEFWAGPGSPVRTLICDKILGHAE